MKKILMGAAALAALSAATPAFASTGASGTYAVSGSVSAYCSINTAGTISLGNLSDSLAALSSTGGLAAADTGAFCNGAGTTVTVTHTSLTSNSAQQASPPTGFTGTITFAPTLSIAGGTAVSGDQTAAPTGAFVGLQVGMTSLNATGKLLAGSYSGTITVTMTPAN